LVTFDNAIIIVEVKYRSDLSSPDQLNKYNDLMDEIGGNKDKYLILLAKESSAREIYNDYPERKTIPKKSANAL
jgi:hypothetical protein